MLPALPVEATSAREADMAGARRGAQPAEKAPAGTTRGTRPQAAKPPAAKGPAARARKPGAAKRAPAKPAPPAEPVDAVDPVDAVEPAAGGKAAKPRAKAAELPVREGEHQWTPAELAEVRAALREQIEALRAEIAASANQIAEGDTSDGAGDDQADAGAKTYEREHELALSYNSQDLLAQIERAVQRMDAGTYGICESCARPIGKARLQVFPRATLCVTCKQREERR
ncbi:TraR/DksA family transcriptional regulator [Actinomadura chibensis]|uniref:TraR/DksA family transcriptional regulator n=1 Tax=Actinomadura chibensis TaxID=392828 RepID=A0A5D0NJN7_9ACTN|nr:TraR/DksA family transcriptional regulator [Actinomadura chibensis]